MPRKKDPDRTYGEKLLILYAELLFSQKKYSLTQLAEKLDCSKQTVLRHIRDLSLSNIPVRDEIIKKQKYFWINRPRSMSSPVHLTPLEYNYLRLCRSFTEHLLGRDRFEDATRAVLKSKDYVDGQNLNGDYYGAMKPGRIDYGPHQKTITAIIQALNEKKVCQIKYRRPMKKRARTHLIAPLKLFAFDGAIYLHGLITITSKSVTKSEVKDPVFAVHRIRDIELTEASFDYPEDYDFDRAFNESFGVIRGEPFEVVVEFTGWSARYVSERIWSNDQKIEQIDEKTIRLTFTASSGVETVGWILWFGPGAKVVEPDWMVNRIKLELEKMVINYD